MPHLEEVFPPSGAVVVRDGKFAHFCSEWDGSLIDETDPEFEVCCCEWNELREEAHRIQDSMWDSRLKAMNDAEPDALQDFYEDFSA